MNTYNEQYKRYYENLRSKNATGTKRAEYRSNDFISVYGTSKKRKEKTFFESMTNVFIYQLVVVVFMLLTMFYLKYSTDNRTLEAYNNIKAVVNDETYTINDNITEEKKLDISEVWKKANDYIKSKLNIIDKTGL